MKKFRFLNGICSMSILAVVTSVSSLLFTSCEKDDFDGTFETTLTPARATINVNVIEFPSGAAVTGATISADKGDASGTTVTLRAGADGSIPAQDVTISATAPEGYEPIQPVTVHVNALKAGGVATYNATLVAVKTPEPPTTPEIPDPDKVVISTEFTPGETFTENPLNFEPTHDHAGSMWAENAHDYSLTLDVEYKLYNEQKAEGKVKEDVDVADFIKGLNYNNTNDEATQKITIPAWNIYRVWTETYQATTVYTFKYEKSGETLGTITATSKYGTAIQYEVMPISHQPGHGHGTGGNAGGGIGSAD